MTQVGEDQEALKAVQNVLKWDPNNIKALFRCGKVGEWVETCVCTSLIAAMVASVVS